MLKEISMRIALNKNIFTLKIGVIVLLYESKVSNMTFYQELLLI